METRYTRAQKEQAIEAFRKQFERGSVLSGEMQELSALLNIPTTTLYGWKVDLKKKLIRDGSFNLKTSKFSVNDKLQAILDTNSMSELEIGEYLRKHGILKEELISWKKILDSSFNKSTDSDVKYRQELAKQNTTVKKLERELARKEKALAELAALAVLQKKVQAIWGETEVD